MNIRGRPSKERPITVHLLFMHKLILLIYVIDLIYEVDLVHVMKFNNLIRVMKWLLRYNTPTIVHILFRYNKSILQYEYSPIITLLR